MLASKADCLAEIGRLVQQEVSLRADNTRLAAELEKAGRRFETIRRRLELILLDEDGGLDLFSELGDRVIPALHDSALLGRDKARASAKAALANGDD